MKTSILSLGLLPSLSLAQVVFDGTFRYDRVNCPTASVTFTPNRQSATIIFPAYEVNTAPGQQDQGCDVFFQLLWPVGCTNLIVTNDISGSVSIDPLVKARVTRTYDVQDGTPRTFTFTTTFPDNGLSFPLRDTFSTNRTNPDAGNARRELAIRGRLNLSNFSQGQAGSLRVSSYTVNLASGAC
ncbi:hypothetical protein QBC35DRAFT_534272 [Podospora australis]|uniref:Ubiquitin 3 binding protein But2 C-terminal domain-containing protein n=1 Tax=Podospora australis TaxID=1536484 RepID=A0AAN7AG17_9PEZI|nr:hypothetical protein QBC35DRAFT_534272 [Podospora australis]